MPDDEKRELKTFDLEAAYDNEISPLMTQVIALCHKHKMPMFATFNYGYDADETRADYCTTLMVEAPDGDNLAMGKMRPLMDRLTVEGDMRPAPMALTIKTIGGDGAVKAVETIVT